MNKIFLLTDDETFCVKTANAEYVNNQTDFYLVAQTTGTRKTIRHEQIVEIVVVTAKNIFASIDHSPVFKIMPDMMKSILAAITMLDKELSERDRLTGSKWCLLYMYNNWPYNKLELPK